MNSLDPRVKLLWSIVWITIVFLVYNIAGQLGILAGIIALIRINRLSLRLVLRSIRYLLLFLPITFLVHFFISVGGWKIFTGSSIFDYHMLEQPLLFTIRVGNLILYMAFALKWTSDIEFLDAIYHILKPLRRFKWQVDDFFQIIFISVKFFPILREEYNRLNEGWKTFTTVKDTTLSDRINRVRDSVIPLMIFSFQRAETLADAMTIRGYGSTGRRSYYGQLKFTYTDWLVSLLAIVILISIIFGIQ